MIALPDVNVPVALTWQKHPHHLAAHAWFARDADQGWATCLLTESGLLRLSMNPRVVGVVGVVGVSLDCTAARNLLKMLVAHPHHTFLEIAPSLMSPTFVVVATRYISYQHMSDAALLHLAWRHQAKLVTFDRGIAQLCPWPGFVEVLSP